MVFLQNTIKDEGVYIGSKTGGNQQNGPKYKDTKEENCGSYNDRGQHGQEIAYGHGKAHGNQGFGLIVTSGKQWEHHGYPHTVKHAYNDKGGQHSGRQGITAYETPIKVDAKNQTRRKTAQPDEGCLLQILLEGAEKGGAGIPLLITGQLQGYIIHGSGAAPNGKDRDAAQIPKDRE